MKQQNVVFTLFFLLLLPFSTTDIYQGFEPMESSAPLGVQFYKEVVFRHLRYKCQPLAAISRQVQDELYIGKRIRGTYFRNPLRVTSELQKVFYPPIGNDLRRTSTNVRDFFNLTQSMWFCQMGAEMLLEWQEDCTRYSSFCTEDPNKSALDIEEYNDFLQLVNCTTADIQTMKRPISTIKETLPSLRTLLSYDYSLEELKGDEERRALDTEYLYNYWSPSKQISQWVRDWRFYNK